MSLYKLKNNFLYPLKYQAIFSILKIFPMRALLMITILYVDSIIIHSGRHGICMCYI